MNSAEGAAPRLARRLRELRHEGLPGTRVTQGDLAEAMAASVPLISSWESKSNPKPPPPERLEAYATFFATERSLDQRPRRLLADSELTAEERARRDELLAELVALRGGVFAQAGLAGDTADDRFAGSHWRFPPGQDITIVCSELPRSYLEAMPYTDPTAPDYVELYRYADLDALLELFGHVRAANPRSDVHVRVPSELLTDDYTSHLVLLGGVDWNVITADLLRRVRLPVRQLARESEDVPGGFEVASGRERTLFAPELRTDGGREVLLEDVALFYRARNPLNEKRTLTMCNGMYQRGTLGAVRALTDARFRDRNEQYLRASFTSTSEFSILSRVSVVNGKAVTPDWTRPGDLLHEWSVEQG